jgi:hypothetical protein
LVIDTYKGRFYMLPEKLASMVTARDDLAAASLTTPRIIARVGSSKSHLLMYSTIKVRNEIQATPQGRRLKRAEVGFALAIKRRPARSMP